MLNLLLEKTAYVSNDKKAIFVVEDSIEGNMTFIFSLGIDKTDTSCYSRYIIHDNYKGEIVICNAQNDSVIQPTENIKLGTYQHDKVLLMSYVLNAADKNGVRMITVSFYEEER